MDKCKCNKYQYIVSEGLQIMAGGIIISNVVGKEHEGRLTLSVLITCLMAASGGLIFGYDIGISGGVSTMEPFLEAFSPSVLMRASAPSKDQYCVYNSQALPAFTSSLYIAGFCICSCGWTCQCRSW